MGFVFFWILCGVGAAMIASARGGNAGMAAVVGFLFGPFGLLFALFMRNEQAQADKQIADGDRKKCPRCAELVQPDALVCKHCGAEFT